MWCWQSNNSRAIWLTNEMTLVTAVDCSVYAYVIISCVLNLKWFFQRRVHSFYFNRSEWLYSTSVTQYEMCLESYRNHERVHLNWASETHSLHRLSLCKDSCTDRQFHQTRLHGCYAATCINFVLIVCTGILKLNQGLLEWKLHYIIPSTCIPGTTSVFSNYMLIP